MYQIQQITSDPSQSQILILPDSTQIAFSMSYAPLQQCWFFNMAYGSAFALNGAQIVTSPNLLQQWRNKLPFGLACFAGGSREPSQIEDFSSGYASLFVLSSDDVAAYTAALQTGAAG